jgi:hypothetical protein
MTPSDQSSAQPLPRVAVISCRVLDAEILHHGRALPNLVHIEWMEQGLHNEPDKLRVELQKTIDRVERDHPEAEVIVLGYGLCSRGTEGVKTSRCKLVIARAHDCITHLLGSKERYADYVKQNPGTYWYSPGWNKHHIPPGKERHDKLRKEYVEKYGDDNADYLMESEQHWFKTYTNAAFVHLGAGEIDKEHAYTKRCADWLGWQCDCQVGDPSLLIAMLAGPWDNDRFLTLNPGQTFRMVPTDRIIEAVG